MNTRRNYLINHIFRRYNYIKRKYPINPAEADKLPGKMNLKSKNSIAYNVFIQYLNTLEVSQHIDVYFHGEISKAGP